MRGAVRSDYPAGQEQAQDDTQHHLLLPRQAVHRPTLAYPAALDNLNRKVIPTASVNHGDRQTAGRDVERFGERGAISGEGEPPPDHRLAVDFETNHATSIGSPAKPLYCVIFTG
jgi:hypothetical protein